MNLSILYIHMPGERVGWLTPTPGGATEERRSMGRKYGEEGVPKYGEEGLTCMV